RGSPLVRCLSTRRPPPTPTPFPYTTLFRSLGKAGKLAAVAAEQAQAALLRNLPDTARKTLERRFEPLHRLLDEARWPARSDQPGDRKSTRLNSSHVKISYAVFCLKTKTP